MGGAFDSEETAATARLQLRRTEEHLNVPGWVLDKVHQHLVQGCRKQLLMLETVLSLFGCLGDRITAVSTLQADVLVQSEDIKIENF